MEDLEGKGRAHVKASLPFFFDSEETRDNALGNNNYLQYRHQYTAPAHPDTLLLSIHSFRNRRLKLGLKRSEKESLKPSIHQSSKQA